MDSVPAALYSIWIGRLPRSVFGSELGARVNLETVLKTLEAAPNPKALAESLDLALKELSGLCPGAGLDGCTWGRVHRLVLRHPLGVKEFGRGPVPRPGDANTVNAAGGGLLQTSGASYRHILDLADWDRSVMTNMPGESGDPASPHYDDLLKDWAAGKYHPMPFSRKAVEQAAAERINLTPRR
jgi:penicillin amidase